MRIVQPSPGPAKKGEQTSRPTPPEARAYADGRAAELRRETSTRLQIFLDNHNFGPGKIDGEMGEFFRKALLAYKRANGCRLTGSVDASFLAEVPEAYTTWVIPPEAENFVGPTSSANRPSRRN